VYERAFGSHFGDGSAAAWWFSAVGTRDGRGRTCWNHNLGVSILDEQTVTCGRALAREHDRGGDLIPRGVFRRRLLESPRALSDDSRPEAFVAPTKASELPMVHTSVGHCLILSGT
jgi:hypothetical protein